MNKVRHSPPATASRELRLEFPAELPIAQRRQEIADAIDANQVVIVAGETGSGKTTQLPKICLQLGRGVGGMIGHTQPRRLAARSVAQRIADELAEPLGETVGFQVRFTDRVSANSRVKLMTDGILLAEIQGDRELRRYDTLIIDEAHERSLNIDFLLGYLKRLLPRRPELKLIITSATIDVESFSRHFDDAPVIEVSGRSYPVETHYLEPDDEAADLVERVAAAVGEIHEGRYGRPGDTLVFLSGEREIRELAQTLRRQGGDRLEILPLYARLSQAEQARVFRPGRGRRVVLATNVAETSLTVPGIRYVVDPGYARISRYSYRHQLQRLPVEAISQASANQRQGRCGRTANGVCLRLYSEQDFQGRPEFTEPEIRRTNLASVILQMLRLRLGSVERFPFINPPDSRLVRDGYKLLTELGAVDRRGRLTSLGRRMAEFPVDPKFSRMLQAGAEAGCLRELLVIVSGLSVQDPRERPPDKRQAADEQHRRFLDERSDFLAWWNLWQYYEEQRQALSQNQLRKLCQREYLSFLRMREWREIHFQLTVACRRAGLRQNSTAADYETLHRSLMSGLLGSLAQHHEGHEYRGSRNRRLQIFPGSSQFKRRPRWLLAGEIVETSRVYAREVAEVDPRWALDINPDLLKHHYYEPHWQARSGRVVAFERITLYGLVLVDRQRVHYGPIDPAESRQILIRSALVEGRMRQPPAFLRHNRKRIQEIERLESKFRRRDLLVDDEAQYRFYDERLPENITTQNRLRAWLKSERGADAGLRMSRLDLSLREVEERREQQFPDTLRWGDFDLQLRYRFEPGHPEDGVTVILPVGLLNRLPRYRFEWLVPGLLREKCIELIKGLPKSLRKQLVPVPDTVDRLLVDMSTEDQPLTDFLAERLRMTTGVRIARDAWPVEQLDDYYRMNLQVVDADGKILAQGRDLAEVLAACHAEAAAAVSAAVSDSPARQGLTAWPEEERIPERWRQRQAGIEIESYPALVDRGDSVAVELLDYPRQAAVAHRLGLLRLYRLQCAAVVRMLRKQLLRGNEYNLLLAGAGLARDTLLEDIVDASLVQALLPGDSRPPVALPRSRADFMAQLQRGRGQIVNWGNSLETLVGNLLPPLASARKQLAGLDSAADAAILGDVTTQLDLLLAPGVMRDTPWEWLRHLPRYLKALDNRLQRYGGQRQKDLRYIEMLEVHGRPLLERLEEESQALMINPELVTYRWMLEEFRVSLFAQALGTAQAVSAKRLEEQWQKVDNWLIENPV